MEFETEVFIADIEVKIRPESEVYEVGHDAGLVYGFTPATNAEEALANLKDELQLLDCEVVRVQSVYAYAGTEWETKKQQKEFDSLAKNVLQHSKTAFSPFFTFPSD